VSKDYKTSNEEAKARYGLSFHRKEVKSTLHETPGYEMFSITFTSGSEKFSTL
jgi:hypothetical protein